MKLRILIAVALTLAVICITETATADEPEKKKISVVIELQNRIDSETIVPRGILSVVIPTSKSYLSVECLSQIFFGGEWAELYCGPAVSPIDNLTLTFAVGMESYGDEFSARGSTYINYSFRNFSVFGLFEMGGSGLAHTISFGYTHEDFITLSLLSQRGDGEGLMTTFGSGHLKLYGSLLFNTEQYLTNRDNFKDNLVSLVGLIITP